MEFTLTAAGSDELRINHQLPADFNGHRLPCHLPTEIKAAFGSLLYQNVKGKGFEIWFSNYHIREKMVVTARAETPVLELHIQFLNGFESNWDGLGAKLLQAYQYNISYTPYLANEVTFNPGKNYQTFDVHFDLPYLQKLAQFYPALDRFLQKVTTGAAASLSEADRFLTPDMLRIINEVLRSPYRNGAALIFMEAKVVELLLLVLDDLSQKNPLAPVKLSPYDIEQLHEVKRLAIADFENPLTIMQLARKVGINDYKLKKGFKYLFGTTIFEYVNNMRMEKARLLLLETDKPIVDIAYLIGFEHESNFNKAFKKHFGYTAAYLRRRR